LSSLKRSQAKTYQVTRSSNLVSTWNTF